MRVCYTVAEAVIVKPMNCTGLHSRNLLGISLNIHHIKSIFKKIVPASCQNVSNIRNRRCNLL
jgi:hypothetical protein